MKFRLLFGLMVMAILAAMLVACGNSPSPAVPTATVAPAVSATTAAPNQPAPTTAPNQPPPTTAPPTKAAAPATNTPVPTKTAPAQPTTAAPLPTDTPTATLAAAQPRPTATSSGPLAATIYVANCRSAPTADKPGRVVVQISVEAGGGNGKYRYYYLDKESPNKFIDVVGEKGTRAIGEVRVTSGDGQELKKEFDIGIGGLDCP